MKKIFLMIIAFASVGTQGYAQKKDSLADAKVQTKTFKISKSVGKVFIDLGNSSIEGYAGNEIIISSQILPEQVDEKAKGLRTVNQAGLEDNTGLDISVTEDGGIVKIRQVNWINPPHKKILVPHGMIIAFENQAKSQEEITFKNIRNELEVSTIYNRIIMENVTGPVTVKSLYGDIDAVFSQIVKGPLSLLTRDGHIDLTLPNNVKSDLKMKTKYGELLVSPELKIEIQKQEKKNPNNNEVNAKINGGGFSIDLSTSNGKIYLRSK